MLISLLKKLSIDKLKLLILNELNSDSEDIQIYSDIFDEKKEAIKSSQVINETEVNELYGLDEREKGQKLTIEQRRKLRELISDSGVQLNEMSTKYNMSYTVLNKLKKEPIDKALNLKRRKINGIHVAKKKIIVGLIKAYIQNCSHTITAQKVTKFVNQELSSDYDPNFIRKVMKTLGNLSYERIKSRPSNIEMNRIKLIRKFFALKFAKMVSSKVLAVNIDESSINKGIMTSYCWEIKGNQ